jgi:hypothetical protein
MSARRDLRNTSLIEEGDRDGWYRQWTATAECVAGYADESAHAGHTISASDAYLRASSYYRAAYLPLYGSPVDPRLVEAFDKETDTFQKAAALITPPVEPVETPTRGPPCPGTSARPTTPAGPGRPSLLRTATTQRSTSCTSTLQPHFAGATTCCSTMARGRVVR